jgi:hypothetical protein
MTYARAQQNVPGLPRSGRPNRADCHCSMSKACMPRGLNVLNSVRHTWPISFILHRPHLSPMPPSKCPGCQQVFEDPRGFANHKRQCRQVKVAAARRLKQFQARNDKNNRTHATQTGDGRSCIEEGRDGPASIVVDGMPLVRLDPLLALV